MSTKATIALFLVANKQLERNVTTYKTNYYQANKFKENLTSYSLYIAMSDQNLIALMMRTKEINYNAPKSSALA